RRCDRSDRGAGARGRWMTACTRCQTALEDGDLRCAICALVVPGAARPVDGPLYAQVLRCRECGAAVAFSAEARAPRCGFCGATMAIEQPVDPIESAQVRLPSPVDPSVPPPARRAGPRPPARSRPRPPPAPPAPR